MIQMQTVLDVADNSGAKKLICVKVLGGSRPCHLHDVHAPLIRRLIHGKTHSAGAARIHEA